MGRCPLTGPGGRQGQTRTVRSLGGTVRSGTAEALRASTWEYIFSETLRPPPPAGSRSPYSPTQYFWRNSSTCCLTGTHRTRTPCFSTSTRRTGGSTAKAQHHFLVVCWACRWSLLGRRLLVINLALGWTLGLLGACLACRLACYNARPAEELLSFTMLL